MATLEQENKKSGNIMAIATMFALFFMIAFVTNFAGSMAVVAKNQFNASATASQLGSAANFFAYLFMGIPGGLILKRKGYKFTALLAAAVGFVGLGVQLLSGYVPASANPFYVYITGAFVAGFSMCLLNLVVNPLLNTLGGGGNKGNQLVQLGCSLNSVGATLAPMILGWLIGGAMDEATVSKVAPAMLIAMALFAVAFVIVWLSKIPEPHMETAEEKADRLAGKTSVVKDIVATLKFRHFTLGALAIFFYITIESGIPNMANLYMSEMEGVGPVIAGSVVASYWFAMMIGRIVGGAIGGKVSSKMMITVLSLMGIATLLAMMYMPVKLVTVFGKTIPVSMCLLFVCGLATSVMWGGIFNLAAEGLGKYVPMGSGIFMACVFGGVCLPLQGMLASKIGYLGSYWFTIALFAYVFVYANFLSKPKAAK
jgi:MFS transporter, FHS family, L-fucose permease